MGRMDWDNLRVFSEAAKAKSLARASGVLGMDRSTVSRRLGELEKSLGTSLFVRSRDGLHLTPPGQELLARVERMASELRSFSTSSDTGQELTGVVRIATTEAMGACLFELGLDALKRRHPALVLEVLASSALADLERGEADIALRFASPRSASLRARKLLTMHYGLYASPEYFARRGLPVDEASDLSGHDALVPSGRLSGLPDAKWWAGHTEARVSVMSDNMATLCTAAQRGLGLLVCIDQWAQQLPGLMQACRVESLGERPLWMVLHADLRKRPAVRHVADALAALFA